MINQFYQSIDLDNATKEQLNTILDKIRKNPCCLKADYKDSSTKGYHIFLICSKDCDVCRMVFDDQRRLEKDMARPPQFRNITFTEKEYFKGRNNKIPNCEHCKKYGNPKQEMQKKQLEIDDVKKKMKIGRINGYPYTVVYMIFDYFECPICHWFMFRKKQHIPTVHIEGHDHQ